MKNFLLAVTGATLVGLFGCSPINSPTTKFTLTVTATNGTVTLSPTGGTYDSGTVVTLTPVGNSGYSFGSWSGSLTGYANPATITMNANKSVTANFIVTPTGIHGIISSDSLWNNPSNDYVIDGDLTITANVTWGRKIQVRVLDGFAIDVNGNGKLTIQEGVVVKFGTGSYLDAGIGTSGTLIAQGSDTLPVRFTRTTGVQNWGYDGTDAGGIIIDDHATALSRLDRCIIDYATSGIFVNTVSPVITNCIIRNNKYFGIDFEYGASPKDSASFVKDSISGNGSYPIHIDAEGLTSLSGDTYINGNATDAIEVTGSDVTKSGNWKKHGVPYVFTSSSVTIGNATGVTITINPGVVCKLAAEVYIETGFDYPGTLIANGTAQDSIKFTNNTAGTYWGYTGSDKGGLWFGQNATSLTSLSYCIIDSATVGVYVGSPAISISNSLIRNNQGSGIVFTDAGSPKDSASFVNNTITANGNYALEINAAHVGNLSGTGTVAGNTKGGIYIIHGSVSADAIWKKYDAPYIVEGEVDIGATAGATLTIRPGSRFELVQEAYFQIGYSGTGAIIANGTATDSIVFTGHIAGTYWGYSGTDKGGILLFDQTASTTSLTYCRIENATAGIFDYADVTIKYCTIRDNQGYGIGFKDGTIPTANVSNNTFLNNHPDTVILN